ncbi:alkaline phosphatase family protein [Solilutibacter tolerans]|uniref:Predicted pyrophosphatase or phosphodiesterase, AlkP superfamily n=1 Tax=Solilutibacter tolerans TaxID=1604334 RepID=A0A1N6TC40_9GAMM|nr:ectonucleotide pyrophosphatase/phosphodiesterase [Lysobacter tolerans]SIQ50929.1 Predicted pyrophosphatase or phosphodiesterase, AlkP superfamily [Lysobacter tolerans]
MRSLQILLVAGLTLVLCACASRPVTASRAPLLLISVDGLRPGDITPNSMPNLSQLATTGVRAEGMRPSYPSLTFPNHYTLVTGLRPDHHGVTHNSMWDVELGEFSVSNRNAVGDGRWWGGEPVWIGADKAGLRTAVLYWPGSEAEIGGVRPHRWQPYDESTSDAWRANTVAKWLTEATSTRPDFVAMYFNRVDSASHDHGPNSAQADTARREIDSAIGQLVGQLQARNMFERTNIVIVSDHGFADVSPGHAIAVEDMISIQAARADSTGQVVTFAPNAGFEAEARRRLLGRHHHYQCWNKTELPADWHYGTHPRVPPIVCQMDMGWDALPRDQVARRMTAGPRGSHGFDPGLPQMRASFIAHGPAFKSGMQLPVFDNVDVYPLLMKLLRLKPAPNDGSARTFDAVLSGH